MILAKVTKMTYSGLPKHKIFLTQRTQRAQSSTLLIAPTARSKQEKKLFSVPSVFSVVKSF